MILTRCAAILAAICAVMVAGADFQVFVNLGQPINVPKVAPNFVGLSMEVNCVQHLLGETGNNEVFAQVLRNLAQQTPGPHAGPVLRLGGNSADVSCFEYAPGTPGCSYNITSADLTAYTNFARITAADLNISFVIGANLGASSDPHKVAVKHIAALAAANLWPIVSAVEIGNEPDVFSSNGHRPSSYNYAQYAAEIAAFEPAFVAAGMPEQFVQGAVFCCDKTDFDTGLASGFISQNRKFLKSISYHRYPLNHCNGNNVTIPQLLATHSSSGQATLLATFVRDAAQGPVPMWVGEGNSVACGGMPGVSDTFAATLWALDFLPEISKVGVVGMNFHGCAGGVYNPIGFDNSNNLQVKPVYYGLYAFAAFTANHSQWINTTSNQQGSDSPVAHHAVTDSAGKTRVLLIARDLAATSALTIAVCPQQKTPPASASFWRVSAPKITSGLGDGLTIAGQTFDKSVNGSRVTETANLGSDKCFSVSLSPLSALVLEW